MVGLGLGVICNDGGVKIGLSFLLGLIVGLVLVTGLDL